MAPSKRGVCALLYIVYVRTHIGLGRSGTPDATPAAACALAARASALGPSRAPSAYMSATATRPRDAYAHICYVVNIMYISIIRGLPFAFRFMLD